MILLPPIPATPPIQAIPVFLGFYRTNNTPVLNSVFGRASLRGLNTIDHNNAIGRYVRTYTIIIYYS